MDILYKLLKFSLILIIALIVIGGTSSCKTKEGCGLEEKYKADMEKTKRGDSSLWSKKQNKRMKKG
jgi:hypothetical protein